MTLSSLAPLTKEKKHFYWLLFTLAMLVCPFFIFQDHQNGFVLVVFMMIQPHFS